MIILLIVTTAFFYAWLYTTKQRTPPLPPGPPAEPLIGHLRLIPSENQEDVFYEWGKQYGDVIHMHVLGRSLIVLNSLEAAIDLLDKRSKIYSDRPRFTLYEIMGWGGSVTFMNYGKPFQRQRRMLQQSMNSRQVVSYQASQIQEARTLLANLLANFKDREDHISRFSIAIIMKITYGYQITSDQDAYLALARDVIEVFHQSGSPGGTPVDFFPLLQHLPSWFPGTFYVDFVRKNKNMIDDVHRIPFQYARDHLAEEPLSFVAAQLQEKDRLGNSDDEIMCAGSSMYIAGAETTWSTISTFIYAMLLNPQVQARAQQEIDSVIGSERLPEFHDRKMLPYVEAVLQETLRWHGAVPLGVPHRCMEDDIYRGMLIPKGTTVIANIRAINLDERVHADPHTFNPVRFLPRPEGNGEPYASENEAFGFGRRICPGRHLAEASVWIAIASILATFNISRSIKEDGSEIIPDITAPFKSGLASHPPALECDILPRSEKARLLIKRESDAVPVPVS